MGDFLPCFEGLSLWSYFSFWFRCIKLFFSCALMYVHRNVCVSSFKRESRIFTIMDQFIWPLLGLRHSLLYCTRSGTFHYYFQYPLFEKKIYLLYKISSDQIINEFSNHLNLHLIKRFSLLYSMAWKNLKDSR